MNLRSAYRFVFLATVIVGCTTLGTNYEALYGPSTPRDRVISPEEIKSANLISFKDDIQPILNRRCVVCHSCYDAPCQLNLTSYEGLDRGANKTPVYNGTRFLTAEPRLLAASMSSPDSRSIAYLQFDVSPESVYPHVDLTGLDVGPITHSLKAGGQRGNLPLDLAPAVR